jgi:phage nucleotide-binding protein
VQITSTKDSHANGLKALAYGDAGAGKTYTIRTICEIGTPLIISAERGTLSLADVDIDVVDVAKLKDVEDVYDALEGSKECEKYDWVCIDSLSEVLEVLLQYEKTQTKDPRQAYGAVIDRGLELVRKFRDLPGRNVYMIAKMEKAKDEATGKMLFYPSFPGAKLSQKVPFLFDEVFALRTEVEDGEITRAFQTSSDGRYVAKDRSGKLDLWEEPDLAQIYSKIVTGG